jgi:hypothetical protein
MATKSSSTLRPRSSAVRYPSTTALTACSPCFALAAARFATRPSSSAGSVLRATHSLRLGSSNVALTVVRDSESVIVAPDDSAAALTAESHRSAVPQASTATELTRPLRSGWFRCRISTRRPPRHRLATRRQRVTGRHASRDAVAGREATLAPASLTLEPGSLCVREDAAVRSSMKVAAQRRLNGPGQCRSQGGSARWQEAIVVDAAVARIRPVCLAVVCIAAGLARRSFLSRSRCFSHHTSCRKGLQRSATTA